MLLCGGCDDYTSWINGKSRRERPSPSEALHLPRNLGECGLFRSLSSVCIGSVTKRLLSSHGPACVQRATPGCALAMTPYTTHGATSPLFTSCIHRSAGTGMYSNLSVTLPQRLVHLSAAHGESALPESTGPTGKRSAGKRACSVWSGGKAAKPYLSLPNWMRGY